MSNTPKLEIVSPDDGPMTIAKPSEFNLDKFKSTRAATMANVETRSAGCRITGSLTPKTS